MINFISSFRGIFPLSRITAHNIMLTFFPGNGDLLICSPALSKYVSKSALTGKWVNDNKKSSVKDHCLLSCHVCSFDDFTVLNYETHKFKRVIKESLLVTNDKALLNKQLNC